MKQETKAPEKKLLHYDELNYLKVQNILIQLTEALNELPISGNDPYSVRALEFTGIMNDCFLSICQEVGVVPDEAFFISALQNGRSALSDKITESVDPNLKEIIISSREKLLHRFQLVINGFKNRVSAEVHFLFVQSMKIFKLESYISFSADGRATVTNECLNELKESFKSYLDSSSKMQALDLLNELASITNQIIKLQQEKNLIPFQIDANYLTEGLTGEITANYELLTYC